MTFTYTGTSGNDNYSYKGSDSFLAYGLAGNDTLSGAYGVNNATLFGGAGNDKLAGYGNNDILIGGAGNDELTGTRDNATIYGGAGNDWLSGSKVGDTTLFGGVGDDTLVGSFTGNNYLVGGRGNDILRSNRKNDTLTGGLGADIFQVPSSAIIDGYATITDFRRAQGDKIKVYDSVSNFSLDKSQNLSGQLALDTAIYYSNVLIAVLQDTTIASLSSDFIFG
jgi:Ca2+-binding RTX toxin-like protein